ncbi:MAG TPA: methyltransferase, TIGR04325 family, partial [Chryseobacterium sp.]
IEGVTEVINLHGRAIVLEDDLNLSTYFLHYMNNSLEKYADNKKVGHIGACNFFANGNKFPSHFFLYTPDCWGWATWSDRWAKFNPIGNDLLAKLALNPEAYKIFNIYDGHYFTDMLKQQIEGKVSSWAIRWQAVCALEGWVTLYPNNSVTQHIESKDATHAHTNITPPLVENKIEYREIEAKVHLYALEAQQSGYAGKTDYYGDSIQKEGVKKVNDNSLKKKIKQLIPKRLVNRYYSLRYNYTPKQEHITKVDKFEMWKGDYPSWREAEKNSGGYDSQIILEKCKNAILEVKNGNAVYERDSVLFDQKQYSFALLCGLQKAAIENNNKLVVLDFGGSLGSTYFQNRDFLEGLDILEWCIIEQEKFVESGNKHITTDQLKFYYSIEDCLKHHKPNVVVISGVLQYIEGYDIIIKKINDLNVPYIIIDRTSFINGAKNLITVQTVPDDIYDASYPCWFFSENAFYQAFSNFCKITDFESFCDGPKFLNGKIWAHWKGAILKKI